ncbi:hypothetical protein NPIL_551091 [Nephila pilipes]|uniref:Uncharacterized protein n=1 Tax=Nephila pilipes TaxID=299642 RepID=A0A8X6MX55_NEPPI|nr:hypothetical protein NPIL_551091 [Nephila pilipes]
MSNLNPGSNIFYPTSSVTNENVKSSFSDTSSVQNRLMSTVLLSTAVFFIRDKYGNLQSVRGLLGAVCVHGFCNASKVAFGAVVYRKSQTPAGDVAIKIVASKSRVAPLKKITVPRLKLCATVLLAKLMQESRQLFD